MSRNGNHVANVVQVEGTVRRRTGPGRSAAQGNLDLNRHQTADLAKQQRRAEITPSIRKPRSQSSEPSIPLNHLSLQADMLVRSKTAPFGSGEELDISSMKKYVKHSSMMDGRDRKPLPPVPKSRYDAEPIPIIEVEEVEASGQHYTKITLEEILVRYKHGWTCGAECHCEIRMLVKGLGIDGAKDKFESFHDLQARFEKFFTKIGQDTKKCEAFKVNLKDLRGMDALLFLDLLDMLSSKGLQVEENSSVRHQFQDWVRKLVRYCEEIPSSILLKNTSFTVEKEGPWTGGGSADIFRGTYNETEVAIKATRIFGDRGDPDQKAWFREAVVWRQAKHIRILPFYGIATGIISRRWCLISPWMKNGNIKTYLENNKSADHFQMVHQIAEGLEYLHRWELYHGDLKPENVLIDDNGNILLGDLGFSRVLKTSAVHQAGGTSSYVAPEFFLPNAQTSPETDVFSYAMTTFEIVSGQLLPKPSGRSDDHSRPGRPLSRGSKVLVPEYIWSILKACWAHNSFQRPKMAAVVKMFPIRFNHTSKLSPYNKAQIDYDRRDYYSSYHLYHALRFKDTNAKLSDLIQQSQSFEDVNVLLRDPDAQKWEAKNWNSEENMAMVLHRMFRLHPEHQQALRETGDRSLLYISSDEYWGYSVKNQSGRNAMGQCIERVREQMRKDGSL